MCVYDFIMGKDGGCGFRETSATSHPAGYTMVWMQCNAGVVGPVSDPDAAAAAMDLRRRGVNMRLSPFISWGIRLGLRLSLSLSFHL